MTRFPLLLIAAMTLLNAADPATPTAYVKHPIGSTKAPYGFIEHLPPAARQAGKQAAFPLVFFMHGHGELGDSNQDLPRLAQHGPFKHLVANDAIGKLLDEHQAIVIAPQGLKSDNWFKAEHLIATLQFVLETYPVDPQRIYVTGLSMGGGGTWTLATAMPDRIAAALPVCGAGKIGKADQLRGMPLWAFHALDDPTVKFANTTQAWFNAILVDQGVKRAGGVMGGVEIGDKTWTGTLATKEWVWEEGSAPSGSLTAASLSLTVYPTGGHDSWTRTYADPTVWKWLFAQKKPAKAK